MSNHFALLDNNYQEDGASYLFTDPVGWVTVDDLAQADDALRAIEQSEHWAVGFISYEFARHFRLDAKETPEGWPYLQFGLFRNRARLTNDEVDAFLASRFEASDPFLANLEHGTSQHAYDQAIADIKDELEAGNSYQVNYTFETRFAQGGSVARLYDELRRAQAVSYGAYLNFPSGQVLSRSPELFFEKRGRKMTCKPMKGTEPRSHDLTLDHISRSQLRASEKQRAENLMIVDLLRNDLSRISEFGSVKVENLFEVESYQTVHQMISTISSTLLDVSFQDILAALFPCGSVTGAPKHATMQIINRLEPQSRAIYCGAIGVVEPEGDMVFNVPIRTVMLQNHQGRFHIGGGVVYDSIDAKEYEEALLKGKFLFDLPKNFRLLDSHYYSPKNGAPLLDRHLARMQKSAEALGFWFEQPAIREALSELYRTTDFEAKIRLELSEAGQINCEAQPLAAFEDEALIALSQTRINAHDPIFQHKTTNRALYNTAFQEARERGLYDVVFANQYEQLTESTIANLVLRFSDEYLTPPLSAGVLPGIGREIALENGQIKEAELPISALKSADEIYLLSALRGWIKVSLKP